MDQRPDQEPPEPGPRGRQIGCGCVLPGSGLVLLLLTAVLAALIGTRDGDPLLWLVLVPLIVGIIALFVRVRVSRGR